VKLYFREKHFKIKSFASEFVFCLKFVKAKQSILCPSTCDSLVEVDGVYSQQQQQQQQQQLQQHPILNLCRGN
jgi:hypothetical protein